MAHGWCDVICIFTPIIRGSHASEILFLKQISNHCACPVIPSTTLWLLPLEIVMLDSVNTTLIFVTVQSSVHWIHELLLIAHHQLKSDEYVFWVIRTKSLIKRMWSLQSTAPTHPPPVHRHCSLTLVYWPTHRVPLLTPARWVSTLALTQILSVDLGNCMPLFF